MFQLAKEEDFEWMASIQKASGLPFWKPNSTSWVVDKKSYVIWQKAGNECELLSVATKEDLRRKGFAKKLMEYSQNELKKLRIDKFYLEVRESNSAAISFYQKLGYEKISERKNYYEDTETAVVMSLSA